jgi:hypothetical protein
MEATPLARDRVIAHWRGFARPGKRRYLLTFRLTTMLNSWSTIPLFLLLLLRYANAYTWQFTNQPRQCQNVSLAVQGSGKPPYSLLIIPSGPSPLANNVEVRTVQSIPFSGSSTSLSFKLNYPENSSFVAVVCLYFVLITAAPSFSNI